MPIKPILAKLYAPILFLFLGLISYAQETQRIYLSGTGSDNTKNWEFFCTAGMNSGVWITIPVPSNWETQGFGKYNYGLDKDTARGKESGLYRYHFKVPADWNNHIIEIVFDGSMTDTEVKINDKIAGPIHQGAFYRFRYNINDLLKYGKSNLLEVKVDKSSSDNFVNRAERFADYWIFGGIFRPVYLEAFPKQFIRRAAINAKADGNFDADLFVQNVNSANVVSAQIFTLDGKEFGQAFHTNISGADSVIHLHSLLQNPLLWNPEFPNLYYVKFTLYENDKVVHFITKRFGFRTIELRERDGIYLNGTKIKFKGICRHSFWPSTGRTLNKNISINDVNLMKDMNMNAVRNSHYPADEHFYDVCDSLGLLVLDELAGWHDAYDTEVGTKLVKEMLYSNMNHPSVILWINGNEGGHNPELVPVFKQLDIQKRPVAQAWEIFNGMDTQHYINYDYGNGTAFHGHDVFYPTEFLHGLYDGGHGAGLEDYWELMWNLPLSAGGFLWDFSDEGVVRTDRDGQIDTDGNHGADGILGPYREKEGSYFTAKEVWSPIHFEPKEIADAFDGKFTIENQYFFTNTRLCKFTYQLSHIENPVQGEKSIGKPQLIVSPDLKPGEKGTLALNLPVNWNFFDILYITAIDPHAKEIYAWSWPIHSPQQVAQKTVVTGGFSPNVSITEKDSLLTASANGTEISFSMLTGLLQHVRNEKGDIPFNNGPVLCEGVSDFKSMNYHVSGDSVIIEYAFGENSNYNSLIWTVYPSGWLKLDVKYCPVRYESTFLGISFSYPEKMVKAIRWMGDGPYRVWKDRMKGTTLNIWDKNYNNTVTGEKDFIYPEFKGYYSNFYCAQIMTTEQPFTIVCASEDVFLRLFTPESPKDPYNTAPPFPSGDISLMHGIPPIGTKSQKAENMGPMGKKNMYYDYGHKMPKELTCYFDFTGK